MVWGSSNVAQHLDQADQRADHAEGGRGIADRAKDLLAFLVTLEIQVAIAAERVFDEFEGQAVDAKLDAFLQEVVTRLDAVEADQALLARLLGELGDLLNQKPRRVLLCDNAAEMPVFSAVITSARVKRRTVAAIAPPTTSSTLGTLTKVMKSPPRKIASRTTAVPLPRPIKVARSIHDTPTSPRRYRGESRARPCTEHATRRSTASMGLDSKRLNG
jgi:hypothetical protein